LVQTIARRGYRFSGEVSEVFESEKTFSAPEILPNEFSSNQPQPVAAINEKSPSSRQYLIAVSLLSLIFATSFAFWWRAAGERNVPAATRNIKAVAILPFKNLNENEPNNPLSLGLTDSLISRLGSLNRFAVRPLDAVQKFAKSEKDALQVGEELKCEAVLEGTFQTIENRLRVNVRLLDVRDGAQIWTASFDETEGDIFQLQDKISAQFANLITSQLSPQDAQILSKKSTENVEAFRAYVRGRAILDRRNADSFEKSSVEFQKAVALDPTFALAYSGLADAFSHRGNTVSWEKASEYYTKSRLYAQKALELDAESAEVYNSLARIKRMHDWDWASAENDFARAIRLNPNFANAHLNYAQMLCFLGRSDEALVEIDRAADINPISPSITVARFAILESRGEYDEALKLAEEFYNFDRENPNAKRALGTFLFHKGEYGRLIETGEQILSKNGEPKFAWLSLLATAYRRTNQHEKAENALLQLELLSQTDTKALYSLAMNYAEFERDDEAIFALQKCLENREERMVWINVEPRFTNLRADSRFREIVQKMRLI
jgi:TolB-like protein/Flp pilus assembly protein TadD